MRNDKQWPVLLCGQTEACRKQFAAPIHHINSDGTPNRHLFAGRKQAVATSSCFDSQSQIIRWYLWQIVRNQIVDGTGIFKGHWQVTQVQRLPKSTEFCVRWISGADPQQAEFQQAVFRILSRKERESLITEFKLPKLDWTLKSGRWLLDDFPERRSVIVSVILC